MIERGKHIERWRRALLDGSSQGGPAETDHPTAEELWSAVRRESSPAERRSVVAHLADCAACREDWRITWELHQREVEGAAASRPSTEVLEGPWGGFRKYAGQVAAAAAVLIVAVGLGMFFHQPPEPTFRGDPSVVETVLENGAGAPLIEEGAALPRDDFHLRWVPDAEGATYRVKVTDAAGDPVHRSAWLEEAEYRVPPEALEDLAAGTTLYWRLEIRRPSFEERRLGSHAVRLQ